MGHVRIILLALLLAGCAEVYSRPGLTATEWKRDLWECELASRGVPAPPLTWAPNPGATGWAGVQQQWAGVSNAGERLAHAGHVRQLFQMCMESKGYIRE